MKRSHSVKKLSSIAFGSVPSLGMAQAEAATTGSPADGSPSDRTAQASASSPRQIVMTVDGREFEVSLYDNPAAEAFLRSLPQAADLSRWGNGEYYGISGSIPTDGAKQVFFQRGEIAFWPPGNALCIFFDRTPVSSDDRPRMDSPGLPLGKIVKGDVSAFEGMPGRVNASIRPAGQLGGSRCE